MHRFMTQIAVLGAVFALGARFSGDENLECESLRIDSHEGSIQISSTASGFLMQVFERGYEKPRCSLGLYSDGARDPSPGLRLFDRDGNLALAVSLDPQARGGELAHLELRDGSRQCIDLRAPIRQRGETWTAPDASLSIFGRPTSDPDDAGQSVAGTRYGPSGLEPFAGTIPK